MSNPASAQVVSARVSASKTARNAVTSFDNPDNAMQERILNRFLEDYYKYPIAISAMR